MLIRQKACKNKSNRKRIEFTKTRESIQKQKKIGLKLELDEKGIALFLLYKNEAPTVLKAIPISRLYQHCVLSAMSTDCLKGPSVWSLV